MFCFQCEQTVGCTGCTGNTNCPSPCGRTEEYDMQQCGMPMKISAL